MIGRLTGIVGEAFYDHIILDVGGVGYIVYITSRISCDIGDKITLIIETQMRENHIQLYGFSDYTERDTLRMLIKVKGISHKVAMSVLNCLTSGQIKDAIIQKNESILRVPGVGKKLAARIVTELQDIAGGLSCGINQDAVSALVNLGYSKSEVLCAINRVLASDTEELIKGALKILTHD